MMIYRWECYNCDRNGATNIAPKCDEDLVCLRCGCKMNLQTFFNSFF